jgi:flagellar transcriptional activator FlhC
MQLLETEIPLSRDRMIRLYREIKGISPPKGMLPSSTDWFMTWRNNIHASLFYNIYLFLAGEAHCTRLESLAKAYRLYLEHCRFADTEPVLDITRAWTLLRFFEGRLLQLTPCCRCTGKFVAYCHDPQQHVVCRACRPPSRAGQRTRAPTLTTTVHS